MNGCERTPEGLLGCDVGLNPIPECMHGAEALQEPGLSRAARKVPQSLILCDKWAITLP